jgi:hypothetical protein
MERTAEGGWDEWIAPCDGRARNPAARGSAMARAGPQWRSDPQWRAVPQERADPQWRAGPLLR